MKINQKLYVTTEKQWRAWLKKNHKTKKEVWLVYYKKHSGKKRIPYNEAVNGALAYGWIDSTAKRIDDHRYAQRFTPRRKGSMVSETNKERIRRMMRLKKMTKAGFDAIGNALKELNKQYRVPGDILRAIQKDKTTWKNFQKFPEGYRRIRIGWIDMARDRRPVFNKRLSYFLKMTKQNKKFGMMQ